MSIPQWLDWAQRLQSIAQSGLSYDPSVFDRQRYEQIAAIAAEMMARGGDSTVDQVYALFDQQVGHATPKVDVRGVVFREGKVLLVQEKLDGGRWTVPGGWADIGESAGESVTREVREEAGYHVRPARLLAAYDRNKHNHPPHAFHVYKLFFLCELTAEEREIDPGNFETEGVNFFPADALPELSTGRVTAEQIARFWHLAQHPELPTDFD